MTTARPDTNALIDDYSDPLFRFFRSHGISYAEAQDLAHDVLVVYYEKDPTEIANHKAFVWGIARNKLLQARTRPRTYEEYRSSLGPEALTSLSELVDRDLRVKALLMQLEEEDERTIFQLRCEGLTIDEIHKITGKSESTIKRRLADTRDKIAKLERDVPKPLDAEDIADHYRKM